MRLDREGSGEPADAGRADATGTTATSSSIARPTVTLHFAQSLDGRIATRSGSARWISGPDATRFAHELRARNDAVLIGSGTAMTDDPLLTVRHVDGPQPLRVVLDARARLGDTAKVLTDASAPTLIVSRRGALRARVHASHVERWELPEGAGGEGVDLTALMARLYARGTRSLLVEGGQRIITAFMRGGLIDRMIVTVAPIVVGTGIDAVGDLGTERLEQALRFETRRVWQLGADVLVELEYRRGTNGASARDGT